MATITLRTLERTLGYSRTTISKALRGALNVRESTAVKIRAAAAKAGYRHNPLAGAIMSELRRSHGDTVRGTLALLELHEDDRPYYASAFHERLAQGAQERAGQLGFRVDRFTVGPRHLPQGRIDQILKSRAIQGVLLLPTWRTPDYLKLDWAHYAGVYMDYNIERPAIRCVCCDHFRSLIGALERLTELGYRRPGVMLPRFHDRRLQHRWAGAFLAFQNVQAAPNSVPLLLADTLDQKTFTPWFKRHQPDVVIAHIEEVMDWMRACGARIPTTHRFFCLNLVNASKPCAGLDQNPLRLGASAAEIVIAHIHRNEYGIPSSHSLTSKPALIVEGPTIRRHGRVRMKSRPAPVAEVLECMQ